VRRKLAAKVNILKKISRINWGCDLSTMRNLVSGTIIPVITYGSQTIPIHSNYNKIISPLYNQAARLITGVFRTTPIVKVLLEANLKPVETLLELQKLKLHYKLQLLPKIFSTVYYNADINIRSLRLPRDRGSRAGSESHQTSPSQDASLNPESTLRRVDQLSRGNTRRTPKTHEEVFDINIFPRPNLPIPFYHQVDTLLRKYNLTEIKCQEICRTRILPPWIPIKIKMDYSIHYESKKNINRYTIAQEFHRYTYEHKFISSSYVYFTDGSKSDSNTSWAFYDQHKNITISSCMGPLSTIFTAEVTALIKCLIYHTACNIQKYKYNYIH